MNISEYAEIALSYHLHFPPNWRPHFHLKIDIFHDENELWVNHFCKFFEMYESNETELFLKMCRYKDYYLESLAKKKSTIYTMKLW